MSVFVRVDVRDLNACQLDFSDLRSSFGGDFRGIDTACDGTRRE